MQTQVMYDEQKQEGIFFLVEDARRLYKYLIELYKAKKQDEKTIDKANELLGG